MRVLRSLWDEPRPGRPPARVWRDWVLVGALLAWSVVETVLVAWRPASLAVAVVVSFSLLWRRTHPLAAVAAAFGALTVFDLVRIALDMDAGLNSVAGALVLPYALFRWGAGREAAQGLLLILFWLVVTRVADPVGAGEVVAAYGFFLLSAALGAAVRFHANARTRQLEQAKLRERNELARELHDAVGHHVSGIAVQAQAGRTFAASDPARALAVLETIEDTASQALKELRAMVGLLRDGAEAEYEPQPGIPGIRRLARSPDTGPPHVDVRMPENLDGVSPPVEAALYRIAQEAVTNALRHARDPSRITVEVTEEADDVRLTVRDDGKAAVAPTSSGYGLAGMAERVALLGGTLRVGPDRELGWTIDALVPKDGAR